MGMVDVAKNIKSTMEDLKKPRPRGAPSRSSSSSQKSSLSPWAWKASLLFWRRLVKKNPPKPHVIRPSISASSSNWAPCKRAKPVPIPTKSYTNYTSNNNLFYYSYPNHTPNDDVNFVSNSMYGYYGVVKSRVRSHSSTGCVAPTTCDYSPNLIDMEYPYFQLLRHSQHVPLPGSRGRLPLYIVS